MKETMDIEKALTAACQHYHAERYEDCITLCWQIVGYDSGIEPAWSVLGGAYFKLGKMHEAFGCMRRSVDLAQDCPNHLSDFAEVLLAIDEPQLAREACDRAIELNPQLGAAYNNLGLALQRLGDFAGSERALKRAEQLEPMMAPAYINRLTALGSIGEINFAIEHGLKAVELFPTSAELKWNLSLLMLKAGRWTEGWPLYQYRWGCAKFPSPRAAFVQPHWNGAKMTGTLLVHAEQGHGDTMMLSRYLDLIRPHVGKIIWHVQPGMGELCKLIAPWAEVADWGTPARFDAHCAMMDLPYICDTTPQRVPVPIAPKVEPIGLLPEGFKIGYCYNGSKDHANNANRSAKLEDFEPLKECGEMLVNLTKDDPALEGSIDPMPMSKDWVTTAHLIAELDLIVTVDTAVAHLAAMMGKPVIVMLPSVNVDWRWMDKHDRTPWYPSMRLVRKQEGQSWREVVQGVVDEMNAAKPVGEIESESTELALA